MNANTASALVESALREHKKDVGFDSFETPDENGFFSADLIASYGEGIAGRYDINAWTGDIWDEFSRKRISNSEVQKIQLKIKKQFKDNDLKYYQHLHDMRAHGVDLEPCP